MLHGQLPIERLVPDETEARSRWWVSSRAYFDGRSFEDEQIPQCVPSSFYTLENNSSFFNMATPSNWQTPNQSNWLSPSNWQTPNPSYLDNVTITGVQQTDNYFNYETVDPDKVTRDTYVLMTEFILDPYDIYLDCYMKGYKLSIFFWLQLVPHLCTYRRERSWPEGWLSSDHMDSDSN
nr:hypothetical protein [Tanacetum cinerariifolium]